MVFFNISPVNTVAAMPIRYNKNTKFCPDSGKKAPANKAQTSNLAPQDINLMPVIDAII
jgi:hypothetical protein